MSPRARHMRILADLRLRPAILEQDLAQWRQQTDVNKRGLGIHQSQVRALTLFFEDMLKVQRRLLAELEPLLGRDEFEIRLDSVEQQLGGMHGIASIFRTMLVQRSVPEYQLPLDLADLTAYQCFEACRQQATASSSALHQPAAVPPLTFLSSEAVARAFSRNKTGIGAFAAPVRTFREQKTPISAIALPFHSTAAIWSYCAIYHEVGHLLDYELNLLEKLKPALDSALQQPGPLEPEVWKSWLREFLADTFGCLFGAAGYAFALAAQLPALQNEPLLANGPHPPALLRILYQQALLQSIDAAAAQQLAAEWRLADHTQIGELAPLITRLARLMLETPLPELGQQSLAQLTAWPDYEQKHWPALYQYLLSGAFAPQPDFSLLRLLPAAAQYALASAESAPPLADLQARATTYAQQLLRFRPQFLDLDGLTQQREQALRERVEQLDFAVLAQAWSGGSQ